MKRFISTTSLRVLSNLNKNNNNNNKFNKSIVGVFNREFSSSNEGLNKVNFGENNNSSTTEPTKVLFNDSQFYQEDKYQGISKEPFSKEIVDTLLADLNPDDIEIKPDGLIYLPEIKYRRILNQAFGPGGWALKPFGPPVVEGKTLIRPYALYCLGRYVAESIGEQQYVPNSFISFATATESAKSNALVRCCKDLGIGSSLWDPIFIRQWKSEYATERWCENSKTKERRLFWFLSNRSENQLPYPWKESDFNQVPSNSSYSSSSSSINNNSNSSNNNNNNSDSSSSINQPQQETISYHQDDSSSPSSKITEQQDDSEDIDIDDVVPPQLKKYAGKTWRQLVADPKGLSYLQWASSSFDNAPKIKSQATAILEFINKSQ
ncbi:mitochondrial genome maintenance protein [Dictyostelium discoideum AX4]|uniref:Mitochondrial genome maintenance protein mgm101 homolog n=1 Tax=Dictyostelium discoideum TaxID=44689 RepID=MG101_DICDI|nr:mitochondrial genome maintenance protein [Dictyostelium discoideum AX4]Q8MYF0.1 RecName: Full=Mitochondrial genome maintenance protein mgm101 homolog; Flags: Precursor [Dictyostelium discoideum]EAL68688.1 mitochondrial genome maintenance protein [Dictyostelium discoideum AX4]|eukprot:XP_642651.1 mitochondrial genome maintenance protein [Dictyostelium discoideum AX4]